MKNQPWAPIFGLQGDLGSIFGPPETPENTYFERKFRDGKNVEKQAVRTVASAGSADPGKEGFRVAKGQVSPI